MQGHCVSKSTDTLLVQELILEFMCVCSQRARWLNEGCGPSLKEDVCFSSGKCVFSGGPPEAVKQVLQPRAVV